MPLSEPAPRKPVHTRRVECQGFRRDDGLWDIEGHLVDTKAYAFHNQARGEIRAGEPVHEMWIRLTVNEALEVVEVEAATDAAPYAICPDIIPAFKVLKGLRIVSGWTQAVKERLGGRQGCTHLVELLGPVATTAFQTIFPLREKEQPADPARRPVLLNSCHALASGSPVVKRRWPRFYDGPPDMP